MRESAVALHRAGNLVLLVTSAALAFSACGHDTIAFEDIPTAFQPGPIEQRRCLPQSVPGMTADPGDEPPGVPYPTPAGKRVQPEITGIPLPLGSRELDGFHARRFGRNATVQVFQVRMATEEVFEFFADVMVAQGWAPGSAQGGVAGLTCEYLPHPPQGSANPPSEWVLVSSEYIPRPGEDTASGEPPPGFRGKGVPFAPRTPGVTTFSILTPR